MSDATCKTTPATEARRLEEARSAESASVGRRSPNASPLPPGTADRNCAQAAPPPWPCRRCGACCRVRGYVHLTPDDIDAIAALLALSVDAFTARYTRLTADRRGLSLVEQANGDCVFLQADNTCRVQRAKPKQCRDFPLRWRYDGYEQVCPSANRTGSV